MKKGDVFNVRSHKCDMCEKLIFTSEIRTLKTFEHNHIVFRTVCGNCYRGRWWVPEKFHERFLSGLLREIKGILKHEKKDAFKRVENYL